MIYRLSKSKFFYLFFLLCSGAFANDFGLTPTGAPAIISTSYGPGEEAELPEYAQFVKDVSDFVPSESLQCVRDELIRIRLTKVKEGESSDTWLSNGGVVADYQLKASQNPCFSVLVSSFYEEIAQDYTVSSDANDTLPNGRASLNARAGEGSFKDIPPGDLWKRALKKANGDQNLAMEIIGYCGHDDVFQNNPDVIISTKDKEASLLSIDYLATNDEKNYIDEIVARSSTGQVMNFLKSNNGLVYQSLKQEVKEGNNLFTRITCPARNSKFYVPGALDPEAVLSEDYTREVARLQAPRKGAQALPGKAYHTNFAAVLSCRLKSRCGLPASVVRQISTGLVSTYRNVRLNALTNKYIKLKKLIEKKFQVSWDDKADMNEMAGEIRQYIEAPDEAVFDLQMDPELIEIVDQFKFKLKWEKIKDYIDASLYYRGGELGRQTTLVPFSAGPDPYYHPDYWTKIGRPQKSYCPGWGETRCNKARHRFETWMKDKDWSVKQNLLGVEFAIKNCPDKEKPISQASCDAVREAIKTKKEEVEAFYCTRDELGLQ